MPKQLADKVLSPLGKFMKKNAFTHEDVGDVCGRTWVYRLRTNQFPLSADMAVALAQIFSKRLGRVVETRELLDARVSTGNAALRRVRARRQKRLVAAEKRHAGAAR
jgi:hypothetical protein